MRSGGNPGVKRKDIRGSVSATLEAPPGREVKNGATASRRDRVEPHATDPPKAKSGCAPALSLPLFDFLARGVFSAYTNSGKKVVVLSDKIHKKQLQTVAIFAKMTKARVFLRPERKLFEMYMKDKRQRITLRLNDEQMQYIVNSASLLDMSPSDYCRSIINLSMSVDKQAAAKIAESIGKGGFGRENDETDCNNIV